MNFAEPSPLYKERCHRLAHSRLYAIVDLKYVEPDAVEDITERLIAGQVDLIQLRAKELPLDQIVVYASKIRKLIPENGPLFIINDHSEIARKVGADGVHLGQEDRPLAEARKITGPDLLLGKSTHSLEQAQAALLEKPDYIGVGPIFKTATKPDYTPVGLTLIQEVREQVPLPQFCIGGINLENIAQVLAAGGRRLVVVSALLQSREISAYALELRRQLENYPLSLT